MLQVASVENNPFKNTSATQLPHDQSLDQRPAPRSTLQRLISRLLRLRHVVFEGFRRHAPAILDTSGEFQLNLGLVFHGPRLCINDGIMLHG